MSFVAVLGALVIVALLYFGYFRMHGTINERSVGTTAIDASRVVACRTQRQAVDRDITMFTQTNPDTPITLSNLERAGVRIPPCPEGGRYDVAGGHLTCSLHD